MSYTTHRSLFTRPARLLFALALALAPILGLASTPAQAASGDCITSGTLVTCTFDFTGAAQTWTVPAGVTSVTIQALGAQGPWWSNGVAPGAGAAGGNGGAVSATINVTAGETLFVSVGGAGVTGGAGAYTISYFSADLAGNTEAAKTLNVTVAASFPATGVRDSFNRANGTVGGSWDGLTGTSFDKIASNRLDVQAGGPLVWKPSSFGTTQEAFITLSAIDSNSPSQGPLLKVQTGSVPNAGAISVVYDAKAKAVRVSALRLGQNGAWTLYPSQAATFANGDVLGARAKADGAVQIYKNGTLIASVTLNAADQAFFNGKGGKIGIWTAAAPNALFDDFGGGTVTP